MFKQVYSGEIAEDLFTFNDIIEVIVNLNRNITIDLFELELTCETIYLYHGFTKVEEQIFEL